VVDIDWEISIENEKTGYPIYEFMDPSGSGVVIRRESDSGGANPRARYTQTNTRV